MHFMGALWGAEARSAWYHASYGEARFRHFAFPLSSVVSRHARVYYPHRFGVLPTRKGYKICDASLVFVNIFDPQSYLGTID